MKPIVNALGIVLAFISIVSTSSAQNCNPPINSPVYPGVSIEGYTFKLVYVDNDCTDPENPMSTWYYCVTSGSAVKPALSHFVFQFCDLSGIISSSILDAGTWTGALPNAVQGSATTSWVVNDNQTGATGLKFDDGFDEGETRGVYLKLNGVFDVGSGIEGMDVGIKAGSIGDTYNGVLEGPCVPNTGLCSEILPIDLVDFTAQPDESVVVIKWVGVGAMLFDRFELEHAINGVDFKNLGTIPGSSDAEIAAYAFQHEDPPVGENFYRLKMVDLDGSFEYSPVRIAIFAKENIDLSTYPNPAVAQITVELPDGHSKLELINPFGQIVLSIQQPTDSKRLKLDLHSYGTGIYILRSQSDQGEVMTKRLIKL